MQTLIIKYDSEALTSKSATIKTCCVEAIHAVNMASRWVDSHVTQKQTYTPCHTETNKQTNKPTDYYTRGRPRTPRVIN